MTDGEHSSPAEAGEPGASAVSFVTTEHFTLQGARSSTIAESTGRASMFLASVSGGLVAWGLVCACPLSETSTSHVGREPPASVNASSTARLTTFAVRVSSRPIDSVSGRP